MQNQMQKCIDFWQKHKGTARFRTVFITVPGILPLRQSRREGTGRIRKDRKATNAICSSGQSGRTRWQKRQRLSVNEMQRILTGVRIPASAEKTVQNVLKNEGGTCHPASHLHFTLSVGRKAEGTRQSTGDAPPRPKPQNTGRRSEPLRAKLQAKPHNILYNRELVRRNISQGLQKLTPM